MSSKLVKTKKQKTTTTTTTKIPKNEEKNGLKFTPTP